MNYKECTNLTMTDEQLNNLIKKINCHFYCAAV